MKEIATKIKSTFRKATFGQESLSNMIWRWGLLGYLAAYFVFNKIIKLVDITFVDILVSLSMIIYFSWHIYSLKKCAPKKPKLNDEEKRKLKEEKKVNFGKSAARKIFLQEPMTSWDPVFVAMIIDITFIAHFLGYILK